MSEPHGMVQLQAEIRAAVAGEIDAAAGQELLTDEIYCTICTRTALRDPVQTPCEHVFHRACLERALKVRRQCPNCRADDAVPVALDSVVCNMITRLLVHCPQQCGARPMPFGSLSSHIEAGGDCPETPIHCANERCRVVTARREAGQHAAVCPRRKEPCPTCNAKIHHSDLQKHNATHGEKRRVPCQHCAELVVLSEQQQHLLEDCSAAVPVKMYAQLQQQKQALEQQKQGLEQRVQELLSAQRCNAAQQGRRRVLARKASPASQGRRVLRTLNTAARPAVATDGKNGIFFDLQCKKRPVAISALWIAHDERSAVAHWSVYTRGTAGSYKGQLGPEGWEKLCDGRFSGGNKSHRCPFSREVVVAASGTQAFYVHCEQGSVKMHCSAEGSVLSADGAIVVLPGTASRSDRAFKNVILVRHHQFDFVGSVEYRVTE
eukprot:TRINITY_DN3794_c0_g1_i2.p1 TRINITY_DN3794_c0_g1~~TRINITY_DN3794_c0_g1_i2.p1  ORF type:complete len:465 (+),score=149.13 TRINITY_DN3794_c0_g1_i2:93-1397(+)